MLARRVKGFASGIIDARKYDGLWSKLLHNFWDFVVL